MPAPHLLIRLQPDGAAEWLALGRDGRVLAGPQSGFPNEGAERIDVLVPSEAVLLLRAPRVARHRRQLEQALPFAIEEQLAAPVETLHVAPSASETGDHLTVAVVARAQLDAWLATLRTAGIEPDALIPEAWLLPHVDHATVLVDRERAVLRYDEAGSFAGHVDEIKDWLALLEAGARRPAALRWIGGETSALADRASEHEEFDSPLRWYARRIAYAPGLNLLQGNRAPRRGQEGAQKLWRWAAGLAAFALLALFAQLLLERAQLAERRDEQRAEMEQLLRGAMPGLTRVVDPKAQLSAEFARLGHGEGQGALPMLARVAPLIAGSGMYTLDAIEFRADTLELTLRTKDVAALDSLREALSNLPGIAAEVTSANPGSGGIEGRLRLRSRP